MGGAPHHDPLGRARTEIVELHRFFEDWFLGRGGELERADRAFHPDFTFTGPDGATTDRAATLRRLDEGRAHTAELTIETVDHRLVVATAEIVVATYVERHLLAGGRSNERLTTVVFAVDDDGPNGLRWLHVQETWLDRS